MTRKSTKKVAAVETNEITEFRAAMQVAFTERAEYETAKNATNSNIQKTLQDLAKSVDFDRIAEIFIAANVSPNFINTSERVSARFNVYAAQKVVNTARAVAKVERLNHYSIAILASAIALENASMTMTHKDAHSACTLSVKTDAVREKHIVKYAKHVDASTASTQSSSSINALKTLNVLGEIRDMSNITCYTVKRDSEATKALCEVLQIAL
jgi:hypothetical protein